MHNQVCVVTGGSSGIGAHVVKLFINNGYQVINLDLKPNTNDPCPDETYIRCDVSNVAMVEQAFNQIENQFGQLNVLVCNAGIHFSANIENTSEQQLDQLFNINVKGAYATIKSSIPIMKQQKSAAIIVISSDQALIGKKNSFAYNLTKAALASIVKTTALDYAEYGIRVNAVCPGTIETELYHQAINKYCARTGADKDQIHKEEAAAQPLGRLGQPEEVAEFVYFLASDKAKFITGSLQLIDGGYTAQ